MVPGTSRVINAALSAALASTLTFGIVAPAWAATSDVAEAVEATKQATRALEKAKKAAKESANELTSASAAIKSANERLANAQVLVTRTEAEQTQAREVVEEVSTKVEEANERTKELEPGGGLIEVAASAAEVATGGSDQPVLDTAASAVKAGLTGVIGPVISLLEPLSDVVNQEIAEADRQFVVAESREQELRRQKMAAVAAHRTASVEWAQATAELTAAQSAVTESTKAEKKAADQSARAVTAVKEAEKAADAARATETKTRMKAAEEKKKEEAAERAAAGRSAAAGTASRSAVVSGRARPGTGSITSHYGMRTHPITGVYKLHSGTDFSYGDGNAYAAADGTVTSVTYDGAYGNMVTVSHGGGTQTRYAHLSSASVSSGQRVSAGRVVGRIGSTGYATGPHLHFEVLIGGDFINPEGWLF
jgi:murein DD-endopeptidase MepM/ murein hydrolase activator NlpD